MIWLLSHSHCSPSGRSPSKQEDNEREDGGRQDYLHLGVQPRLGARAGAAATHRVIISNVNLNIVQVCVSVYNLILWFSEWAHFKTVPCSVKQKPGKRAGPGKWDTATVAIMNIKANPRCCQCPDLFSWYSEWWASPLSPPISLLGPPLWLLLLLDESLDKKHLEIANTNKIWVVDPKIQIYLRMLMSSESSQRQVIPAS